ncbi:phospholipase D family protein [Salmonella enterica]|nr:phospholipase D family protein [Salmonella enterica]EDL1834439.1 phospholipase D family protein [Salmonella enterica subsp. enterica serovar Montevideo]EBE5400752.1 phospholipase D family protein [Salmonella enterica]EBE9419210.1 phospholipase D family protein [Salmonella enterica]EBN1326355.1 phospholipase D family protein [Salmonella enterica]
MRKTLLMALTIATASPLLAVAAPLIDVGFSPAISHSALEVVLSSIEGAEKSVDIAAYSFTSKPVAAALVAASKRGVAVRVVADQKANNDRYTAVTFLANQGVPVRLNSQYAIMHNKFMVIDGDTVQTGSFNYTASAVSRNAENALRVKGVPELARAYLGEFNRLWNESKTLTGRY